MSEFRSRSGSNRNTARHSTRGGLRLSPALSLAAGAGVILLLIVMFPLDWLRRPEVSIITDLAVVSPNQDGVFDQVTIFYNLSDQATVSVRVLNETGQVIRTLVRDQEQPAGQHVASWDGRDEGGIAVPDGRYIVKASAAGAAQGSEQSTTVAVDSAPPPLVIANFLPSQTTRESTFVIEGTTAPDATVWVNDDPFPLTVDGSGIFHATRQLREGANPIVVRAVDSAGNQTQAQAEVVLRTAPPLLTLTSPEPEVWVKSSIVTVSGSVLPDVNVTVNDQRVAVNENGEFALDVVLQEGDSTIRVTASDAVGNSTSEERIVHIRTRGPVITLANLTEGMVVSDLSLRVSGQVDPGSTLTLNGSVIPVDNRGNFSAVVALRNGANLITVSATDRAGNTTTVQRGVTYAAATIAEPGNFLTRLLSGESLLRVLAGAGLVALIGFLLAGWRRPLRVDLSANRSTFYPNQPGDNRMLNIRLRLSRDARVTMAIYDQMDRRVMMLCENRPYSAGENQRLWDGQDASGRLLPDGIYQIEAIAASGWSTANSAAWVSLDTSPALVGRTQRERLYNYLPSDEEPDR